MIMILCVPGAFIAPAAVVSDNATRATNDAQSMDERSIGFPFEFACVVYRA
jgi:hypothetical protein